MKLNRGLALLFAFFLFACQPATPPTVSIIDNDKVLTLQTDERVPSAIFKQAGITLNPNDRVLLNGLPVAFDQPITNQPITFQLRRAVNITLITPQGEQQIQSSAFTVGEVLQEAGIRFSTSDQIDPPVNSPITQLPITIHYTPARELTVSVDGKIVKIKSSAQTVGEALAEAGIPLMGEDYSRPDEKEALPQDGKIDVVRVSESVLLAQKPIPFKTDFQASADVALDQQQVLQPGETGLSVSRIRIRYENGQEVSRLTESETTVKEPKTRIVGYGTKIVINTAVVDGVKIEYWRAVQMYATSYSPCRSGGGRCYSGTASGATVKKGVVGVRYSWYLNMRGQPLYISGYGYASVEDVCGGCVGKPWIDLGYSDNDYVPWSSWVTVYFLAPAPSNILYVLE